MQNIQSRIQAQLQAFDGLIARAKALGEARPSNPQHVEHTLTPCSKRWA